MRYILNNNIEFLDLGQISLLDVVKFKIKILF